jgi:hypothetical protein
VSLSRGEKVAPDVLKAIECIELDTGTNLDRLKSMSHDEQRRAVGEAGARQLEDRKKGRQVINSATDDIIRNDIADELVEFLAGLASGASARTRPASLRPTFPWLFARARRQQNCIEGARDTP